jgi:hypothetical protein
LITKKTGEDPHYIEGAEYIPQHVFTVVPKSPHQTIEERSVMMDAMKCVDGHSALRQDLMTEMWEGYCTRNSDSVDDDN